MGTQWLPTNGQIREVFTNKVREAGGRVSDTFDDGTRLFLRAVLATTREVRVGDGVQGGVALRATETMVWVHPYVFRQVCRNGAIIATTLATESFERVEDSEFAESQDAVTRLAEAIRSCCTEDAMVEVVGRMRTAAEIEADMMLHLLPLLRMLPEDARSAILKRFESGRDRTWYGFMNAITSLARDTREPERRWELEELGGSIAWLVPTPPRSSEGAMALRA